MKYFNKNINGVEYLYIYDVNDNRMLIKMDKPLTQQTLNIAFNIFKNEVYEN